MYGSSYFITSLPKDIYLRDKIGEVRIGDQIKIKGWLANYESNGTGKRGNSIIRTDTGNGACETIYVKDVEIIKQYAN